MKITIIGPAHPYRGGLATYNERMAREFIAQGHQVTMYTFTLQYPSFLFPGKTQYSSEEVPKDLNIIRALSSVNPLNWLRIGNRIKKERPDIVLIKYWLPFMGPSYGTILRQIKKNKHTKVICLVDNIIPHEKRIGDKTFTKYFVKPVDAFLTMSENVLTDLEQFNTTKPRVLSPHPVFDNFGAIIPRERALEYLKLDDKFRYILFFGFVRKYKGLDLLLEAFADKRFKNKNLRLIVAGEYYTGKEEYDALIDTLKLNDEIIQIDRFIDDSEVQYIFNACDLVVQPYKSATQSGVTQIAYHFNKPMIVTNVGGLTEMCPDGKVGYVVPIDSEKITDAILKYFESTDKDEMCKNIIKEKRKYSWSILTEKLLSLYYKIS